MKDHQGAQGAWQLGPAPIGLGDDALDMGCFGWVGTSGGQVRKCPIRRNAARFGCIGRRPAALSQSCKGLSSAPREKIDGCIRYRRIDEQSFPTINQRS